MNVTKFEELEIWQESRKLCKIVYEITEYQSFSKDFGFKNQIKKACGSVMDNIAEGFGRDGNKEFINFLSISKGSLFEVRSQIYRAFDVQYIKKDKFDELIRLTSKIAKKITNFMEYLKKSDRKGSKFEESKTPTQQRTQGKQN